MATSRPGSRRGKTSLAADTMPADGADAAAPEPSAAARAARKTSAGHRAKSSAAAGNDARPVGPDAVSALQREYLLRFNELFARCMSGAAPELKDSRFAGKAWQEHPVHGWQAAWYLFNAEFLKRSAELLCLEGKARDRLRFVVRQWIDAVSPANFFASNPDAQARMIETQGESLRRGIDNLLHDLRQGRISQTDSSAFEVGRNVGVTPGSVIYENELVQLIQYRPATSAVGERPLLIVPPAINKFYILDLQPANSFVAHAVAEGHTVFLVSWRNVEEDQATLSWDDYLQKGIIDPIHVVQEISGQPTINTLGFCLGGTLLATALAAMAARGERPAESLTLLTTLLDFADPGMIGVFIDESHVVLREQTIGRRGLMSGRELATAFSFLRPNELVWNYVVGNYLKGDTPPAFDLLYWNADSTNLAGPMFCTYLRHTYLQNELSRPGKFHSLGVPIDLRVIDVPTYALCAREDHIVPWQGGYVSARALGGKPRFILTASGHIAGVVNPPAKQKRSYQVGPDIDALAPEQWQERAETFPGSWWVDWYRWLEAFKGASIPASDEPGSARYRPIEPAPGRYVKEKI
ncbi:MAG: class I poly(R)-hydroxyalkanoic acid synthase [Lautropia sp.]|nr:class I poly(R)-hydroxyalkanoic acid synthase [Lautropia sp.]